MKLGKNKCVEGMASDYRYNIEHRSKQWTHQRRLEHILNVYIRVCHCHMHKNKEWR